VSCRFRGLRLGTRSSRIRNHRGIRTMAPRAKCWAMPRHSWIAKARSEERLVFCRHHRTQAGGASAAGVAGRTGSRGAEIVTMGELTASIAHEINQPLAAVTT
jgi:hypothetical protein